MWFFAFVFSFTVTGFGAFCAFSSYNRFIIINLNFTRLHGSSCNHIIEGIKCGYSRGVYILRNFLPIPSLSKKL